MEEEIIGQCVCVTQTRGHTTLVLYCTYDFLNLTRLDSGEVVCMCVFV